MTDTEPAQKPDLGTASNKLFELEMVVRLLRGVAAFARINYSETGAADMVDGCANATERALDQLRYDMRHDIYECERTTRD